MNKTIEKFQSIIIVTIFILILFSALGGFDNTLWHIIDAIVTISTVIGVWYNYKQNQKQLEPIKIYLSTQVEPLSSFVLRKNFNRAEVKGILRELAQESEYKIDYISNPKSTFLKDIYNIQIGETDQLTVIIQEGDTFTLKEDV